jgi:hypothetical protein
LSRTGAAIARGAREIEPYAGFAGELAPNLVPLGAAVRSATVGGSVLRGAGIGGVYGVLAPTGQDEPADRVGSKGISAALGTGLGGALGLFGRLTGARSREQLNELRDLIKSNRFQEEVTAGARSISAAATEAAERDIAALQRAGELTETQARDAIRQLRLGRDRSRNPFVERREVAREAGEAGRQAGQDVAFFQETLRRAPTEAEIGQTGLNRITQFIRGLRGNNRSIADAMYREADDAMLQKFEAGDIWQNSPSGRAFLNDLRSRIDTSEVTQATQSARAEIQRILSDLQGATTSTPAGAVLTATGQPAQAAATRISPSTPEVLRETLRKLRDAASGRPEEGFAAIGQQRAGSLANDLAEAIRKWEPSLSEADASYRQLMQLLRPTQTARGRAATAGERFDYTEPAIDPVRLVGRWFESPQGVRQLTELVGGDSAFVNNLANQYVARQLANKTPEQARAWLRSSDTINWLNPNVLPQATAQANRIVSAMEGAAQRGAQATQTAADAARGQQTNLTSFRERLAGVREGVATARTAREAAEKAIRETEERARQGLEQLETPIRQLAENYRRGGVSGQDLPNRIRQILNNNVDTIPTEVAEALNKKLNDFQNIRDSEARARATAAWVFGGGTAAALLGREFAPSIFGRNR